jgi:hypothetical protein
VVLTDTGWEVLRAAAPAHVRSVRSHFIDLLSPEELEMFARVTAKVIDHLGGDGQSESTEPVHGRGRTRVSRGAG